MDISVIIPTYNRKEKLLACLYSLFTQDYPQEGFEIIVVDDGSTDGTGEMIKELSAAHLNLRYFRQAHKGPAAARNLGMIESRSGIVGFTDTDCALSVNWVRSMVEAHTLSGDDITAVGGQTKVNPDNIKAVVSQYLSDGAIKTNLNGKEEVIFSPTCNVSFKKSHLQWEEFNEAFPLPGGEDLEFFWRIFKQGCRFIYRQDIKIYHNCHSTLRSFLEQAYMYGRGNYLVQYIHRDHPLLKEIRNQDSLSFISGLAVNFLKIPRFSLLLGRRLMHSYGWSSAGRRFKVYAYFALHKIMYLLGNIAEHQRPHMRDDCRKPGLIILDITHLCNLRCNVCEISKDKRAEEFLTEEVKRIILQSKEWGVKDFVLSGGEPLLRDDIFEILDFAKEQRYQVGVLSNGILLNNGFIEKLSPYLISKTLSLSISLDALSPVIHDGIRGAQGSFEKTVSGLKQLSGLKSKYPEINFNTISIILNENLEELLGLADFLKSLNVNSIQFQPLLPNNLIMRERPGGKIKYWVSPERLALLDSVVDELVEFKRRNFQLVRNSEGNLSLIKKYFRKTLNSEDVKCSYADKTMLIANNGDVTTCFTCYGNVRGSSLRGIFYSRRAAQARQALKNCRHPCLLPCFTDD